jgi:predicted negative regulator of RcsB-dependent stress response
MDDDNFDTLEQSERARGMFQKHAGSVVMGVLAAVAIMWGYRGWESSKVRSLQQAESAYSTFAKALDGKEEAKISQLAAQMRVTHAGTTYASVASMDEAKFLIEAGKLAAAEMPLKFAAANGKSSEWRELAQLRLARLLMALNKPQDSLAALQNVNNEGFNAQIQEIRGDAYVLLQKLTEARAAYASALTATDLKDANRATLQQKMDNLAELKS